jgi:iron transport multicopper oxidase
VLTVQRAYFNNITYAGQKVPTLYTAFSAGSEAMNPAIYGASINPFVVSYGQIVQIVVNNKDNGEYSRFHLPFPNRGS